MADPGNVCIASGEPDALVAIGSAGDRTLADLLRDAAAIARSLPPKPQPGDEVLLACEDRYWFTAGLLGAWLAKFAVALPPNTQPETLRLLAARPRTKAFLHDGKGESERDMRGLVARYPGAAANPLLLEPSRYLITVYSSGSTGPNQACPKTASQILGEAALQASLFGVKSTDRVLATVPAHHIYGLLFSVLVPLTAGAAFVRTSPLHAEAVAAEARASRASLLVTVPAHLRALSCLGKEELPFRLIFSSGAPLDDATAEKIARLCPEAFEILGSSETGGIATRRVASGPAWHPLQGVRVFAGEGGQMLLASPFLEPGSPHPRPCADRIEMLGEGNFRHLGRLDDVVKVAGKRVALSDLQARLRAQAGVTDAAVFAVPSSRHGSELRAVASGVELDPAALRQALLQHFDATVVPREIHVVAKLPVMENGKLALSRLRELTGDELTATPDDGAIPARPIPIVPIADDELAADRRGDNAQRFEVKIDPGLRWFRGHFAGFPLLPGVVQLEVIVAAQIRRSWPELGAVRRLSQLKFRKPIRPGDELVLELARSGSSVDYTLSLGADICSSGTLEHNPEQA
jgi:acyl-CoA synthetase (AMP-forming)/AMP-acid ligase II